MRTPIVCMLFFLNLTACVCDHEAPDPSYDSLRPFDPVYDDYSSSYWKQVRKNKLPLDYAMDKKLLLIAHGFDPHVRVTLAADLWDEVRLSPEKTDALVGFLDSNDPSLAWAAAWTIEKCSDIRHIHSYKEVYRRPDVIGFKEKYHQ